MATLHAKGSRAGTLAVPAKGAGSREQPYLRFSFLASHGENESAAKDNQ
jgi:hypothetical protein